MKYFVIIATALVLTGCGAIQRQEAHWAGRTKVCVDGVTYLQFPTGTVEQRTIDDKLVACK